jgi:PhzF family phenazine biosynthesis protein
MDFRHVDVFTERPYAGNGLVVMFGGVERSADALLAVTAEMRQFESIFVDVEPDSRAVTARIFTVEEELPFAGHPVIGAAAASHERFAGGEEERFWTFRIASRDVAVTSRRTAAYFEAEMNQGPPTDPTTVPDPVAANLLSALSLDAAHLRDLPTQVISTGLPYVILPVTADGLGAAHICVNDLETRLEGVGAKFIYAFDPDAREGRTWDNLGAVEDVATGSAAGPAAAYLFEHGLADSGGEVVLRQGRFAGRPSSMSVRLRGGEIWVGGPVAPVARGTLDAIGA